MKQSLFWVTVVIAILLTSCSGDEPKMEEGYGKFKPTFTADYTVKDSRTATKSASVPSVVQPDVNDFYVHLSRTDGSVDKTWSKVSAMSQTEKFPVGKYNLEMYYGNINDEGFDKPYYYGSTEFTIYDGEVSEPEVKATLCNTMVSIDYTDAFKAYFTDYETIIHSGGGDYITFESTETRAAYVKPGNIVMSITLTNREGNTVTIEPASIANAQPKTHYRITFDVNGGEVGDAVLVITFDETVEDGGEVSITLGDELFNAEEPAITADNFTSGETISMIEGDVIANSPKVHLAAMAGFSEVTLTTQSEYLLAQGWPAELDLTKATSAQKALLMKYGLKVSGLWGTSACTMAMVDFSEVLPALRVYNGSSTHSFTLVAKDILTRVTEPVTFSVSAPSVILTIPSSVTIEPAVTEVTCEVTYSGVDFAENVLIQCQKANGTWVDSEIKSVTALGDNKYSVTFTVPLIADDIQVRAIYRNGVKTVDGLTVAHNIPSLTLAVNDYDVWAYNAALTYSSSNENYADLNKVLSVYLSSDGGKTFAAVSPSNITVDGQNISLTNLKTGTVYQAKISVAGTPNIASNIVSFSTETAAQIPNSDMESWSTVQNSTVNSAYEFMPYSEGETDIWWATNSKRSMDGNKIFGIWSEVAFSPCVSYTTTEVHGGSRAALIYTSGHGGGYASTSAVIYTKGAFAGELFIGSYTYKGSAEADVVYGHTFSSRPKSLSFWYKYQPKNTDHFVVTVELKSNDTVIAEGSLVSDDTSVTDAAYRQATIAFNYSDLTKKATSISVSFKSTYRTSFSDSDFDKARSITFPKPMGDWSAHMGSILLIDDLSLTY
ncbi:MAG: DUF4493 domain-containing protein [Muribaculaceae bacterium]